MDGRRCSRWGAGSARSGTDWNGWPGACWFLGELGFAGSDAVEFLLMTELRGRPGHDPAVLARPDRLVDDLAAVLRLVHVVPTAECPFDARTGTLLAVAEQRAFGLRAGDLASRYLFRSPVDLLADLIRLRPADEDLVFTHGDASVVNFLFGESTTHRRLRPRRRR